MESLQDQITYGRHCVHGVPVGTPGGADLMCGYCEDGDVWWVESPRYGLFIETISTGLTSGAVAEWSDPLTADDEYIARAWARISEWVAMAEGHDDVRLIVKPTRLGYWDQVPTDSASHAAAGHTLPERGREGYCLTCFYDLADIESWSQRVERLACERRETIASVKAMFDLTDDELEEYRNELYSIVLLRADLRAGVELHGLEARYADELIAQEDENIASYS